MTRTEHIKNLQQLLDFLENVNVFTLSDEIIDSLKFVIDSLEVDEPSECNAEDCISRSQTIKDMCLHCDVPNCRYRDKGIIHASCDDVDILKRVPSVYPKKEDYLKANEQLKKQLEMLKLDRNCDNSVLEDI